MSRWCVVVFLFSVARLSVGVMQGPLIKDIAFYRTFDMLASLRCGTVYGRGAHLNQLVSSSEDNVQAVRRTLTTDAEESFFDRLRINSDHDIGIFSTDELCRKMILITETVGFTSLQTYMNLSSTWDDMDYSTATSIITTWSPEVHLLMKETVMCNWMSRMDETVLGLLCGRLAESTVTLNAVLEYLDRCAYCIGIAVKNEDKESYTGFLTGYKAAGFMAKLKQIYPKSDDWDTHLLVLVPSAVTEEDVEKVDDTHFCSQNQMVRLTHTKFYDNLSRGVKVYIAERIRKCMNMKISDWSNENMRYYAPYIIHLPHKTLNDEFSGAVFASNIAIFLNTTDVLMSGFLQTVGWMIKDYWKQASASLDDQTKTLLLCVAVKFAPDHTFFDIVSPSVLQIVFENIDLCSSMKISQEELAGVVERFITSANFTWDNTIYPVLGPVIGDVRLSVLMSNGVASLCQHWVSLKDLPLPTSVIMKVWESCSTYYQHLNTWECEMITAAGSFITMFDKTDISTISGRFLYECRVYLEGVVARTAICASYPGFCDAVVAQIKAYGETAGMSVTDIINNLGPNLAASVDNVNENELNLASLKDIPNNNVLASTIWNLMKTTHGEVTTGNTAYTSSKLSDVTVVLALGTPLTDLLNLPEDDGLLDLMTDLSQHMQAMSGKKKEVILTKLTKMFGIYNNSLGIKCVEAPIAEEVGVYFSRASVNVFFKLYPATRKAVLKGIGHDHKSVQMISPFRMRTLTNIMLRTERIEIAASYTKKHVELYGPYIWCGMNKAQSQKLTSSALTKYFKEIAQCGIHFDSKTRAAVVLALKTHLDSTGSSLYQRPDILQTLGHFVPDIADTFITSALTQADTDRLVSITRNIFSKISEFVAQISSIDENVIKQEDRQQYVENVKTLASRLYTLALGSGTVSCQLLQVFQGHLGFLTHDVLQVLSVKDVVDCLPEFQGDSLTADVVTIIIGKLKESDGFGDPASWTSSDTVRAGKLLDALTSSEINALIFTDQIIAAINHIEFSKSADIISAYLDDKRISQTTTLDKDTLSLMGTLFCGFSVSQINDLNKEAAYNAARDLCHIKCLNTEQLQAFGEKLSSYRGPDWSTVDPQIVASLGVCMGGLPSSDLNTLSLEQIGNLQPFAVKNIPPNIFSEVFDEYKLATLSSDQANVITEQQRAALNAQELITLNERTTLKEEDTSIFSSGGTRLQCGITVMTFVSFVLTFQINI